MKEITLKVYEYKDLTEKAQSKALDELKEQIIKTLYGLTQKGEMC
jgi:hypothetical protein